MSSPIPDSSLEGGCSVIDNNILYVYTSNAFQSLPLSNGSTWSQLPLGVPVTGHTCVRTTDNDTDSNSALWIVGGKAINTSTFSYPGLQRFSFSTKSWETIVPVVNVTQSRQNHASVFLNASSEILVYAGSQDGGDEPTTQTFVISTMAPYSVVSWGSQNTPVKSPSLLRWNESSAITLGGSDNNTNIYQFTPVKGWTKLGTSLKTALSSSEKCTLVSGSDESKVLNVYDMSVSPNMVSQIVLQDADGKLAPPGQIVANVTTTKKRKRVTLSAWPPYNDIFAPTATRTSYSLAQNDDGLVAVSGGNTQYPIALFNEQSNAWVNSSQFFGLSNAATTATPSATSSSVSASSVTATSTSTPNIAATRTSHPKTSIILGAVLGSVLGVIALLILALILLRLRTKKNQRRVAAAAAEDEKKRMSFADRGAPFMMEAGGAVNKRNSGRDSMAILGGRIGPGYTRNLNTAGSDSSTANLVPPPRWDATMRPIPGGATPPEVLEGQYLRPGPLGDPKRTSGWSQYFGGSSRKSGHLSSHLDPSPRVSQISRDVSQHTADEREAHNCNTHGPTVVPELNLKPQWEASRVSTVVTGKPTVMKDLPGDAPRPGTTASGIASSRTQHRPRPSNVSRNSSNHSGSSARSSGPISSHDSLFAREGINEREWTPVTQHEWNTSRNRDTSTSSVYTHQRGPSDVVRSNIDMPVPAFTTFHVGAPSASAEPTFSSSPPRASPIAGAPTIVLPGLFHPAEVAKVQRPPVHSDMSWVNLNGNSTR